MALWHQSDQYADHDWTCEKIYHEDLRFSEEHLGFKDLPIAAEVSKLMDKAGLLTGRHSVRSVLPTFLWRRNTLGVESEAI